MNRVRDVLHGNGNLFIYASESPMEFENRFIANAILKRSSVGRFTLRYVLKLISRRGERTSDSERVNFWRRI